MNHLKFSKNNNIEPFDYLEGKIELGILYCIKYDINLSEKYSYFSEIKSIQDKKNNNEILKISAKLFF